jgi:hypothetical protein
MKHRLQRLEKLEGEAFGVLTLPDGTSVRYRHGSLNEGGDMYSAFCACMAGEEHWLLPYIRQMDSAEGFPRLIRALEDSRERAESDEE